MKNSKPLRRVTSNSRSKSPLNRGNTTALRKSRTRSALSNELKMRAILDRAGVHSYHPSLQQQSYCQHGDDSFSKQNQQEMTFTNE